MPKRALLLSGGMDSIAIAYWLRPEIAFTLNYGQVAADAEVAAASAVCTALEIEHQVLTVDCSDIGSDDLSGRDALDLAPKSDWWPFRNQMLVTLCGMAALSKGVSEIWVGSVKNDGYHKDGGEDFYQLLSQLMSSQEGGLTVTAPAIHLTTTELIKKSAVPDELLMWAHSCHKSNTPCCNCRGCNKYFSVLAELGISGD